MNDKLKSKGKALRRLRRAARKVLHDYDACSGAEPSLSVLHRSIDVNLRGALGAMLEFRKGSKKPAG